MGERKPKNIEVDEDLWNKFSAIGKLKDQSLPEQQEEAMLLYIRKNKKLFLDSAKEE